MFWQKKKKKIYSDPFGVLFLNKQEEFLKKLRSETRFEGTHLLLLDPASYD